MTRIPFPPAEVIRVWGFADVASAPLHRWAPMNADGRGHGVRAQLAGRILRPAFAPARRKPRDCRRGWPTRRVVQSLRPFTRRQGKSYPAILVNRAKRSRE